MKRINYLAAFGTILFFIGIFCFKAAFQKETSRNKMITAHYVPAKKLGKGYLILLGAVFSVCGILLIIKSFYKVMGDTQF